MTALELIAQIQNESGLSRYAWAKLTRIPVSTVNMILGQGRSPGRRTLARLAAAYPERRQEITAILLST